MYFCGAPPEITPSDFAMPAERFGGRRQSAATPKREPDGNRASENAAAPAMSAESDHPRPWGRRATTQRAPLGGGTSSYRQIFRASP